MEVLRIGSSGEEVRKLQQRLVDEGYSVGNAGVDGKYGNDTASAVKRYQASNQLEVDGVAGPMTQSRLYGTQNESGQDAVSGGEKRQVQAKQETPATSDNPAYASATDEAYQKALSALQKSQKNMPTYGATYDQQLADLYEQIVNREKFNYDMNADALYQQYAQQYAQLGQLAMRDTMGQAAALTGGYGNSYAQTVGQQTYQQYLSQLNDKVPELYGLALDQYNREGQDMLNRYSILNDLQDEEYARYQDQLDRYWQNVQLDYQTWRDTVGDQQWQQSFDYGVQQDKANNLIGLMTSAGYQPSEDELAAAGISKEQADAYRQVYELSRVYSSGGGGGSGRGGSENPDKATQLKYVSSMSSADLVAAMQGYQMMKDNTGLEVFLNDCVTSGRLTQEQAINYYGMYHVEEYTKPSGTNSYTGGGGVNRTYTK